MNSGCSRLSEELHVKSPLLGKGGEPIDCFGWFLLFFIYFFNFFLYRYFILILLYFDF